MLAKFSSPRNPGLRITLMVFFILVFLLSGLAAAQAGPENPFTLTLSVPDCQVISSNSTSASYKLEKLVNPEKAYFRWDFSNGMDRTLEKNLLEITLFNVDDNVEVKLDRGRPADFLNFNGTTIEAGDFKYTKLGRNPEPKIRRVEMTLKSNVLEPSKNYILTIGPKFEANNGNTLNKTYSWKFATNEAQTVTGVGKQLTQTPPVDPNNKAGLSPKPLEKSGPTGNPDGGIKSENTGQDEPTGGGKGDGSGGGKNQPLELVSSTPADGDSGVALDTEIRLSFNKNVVNMMVSDNNLKCFSLYANNEPVAIEVQLADDQMEPEFKEDVVLVPVEGLQPDKSYTIKVASGLQSKSGVTLGKELQINFATGNGMESPETVASSSNEKPADAANNAAEKGKNNIPAVILIAVIAAGGLTYIFVRRK